MDPLALVLRVRDLVGLPLALVVGVRDEGCLVLAVELLVPVLGLLGLRIHDVLRDIVPALWLLILGIIDVLFVHPVGRLALLRILDLLGRQEVEIIEQVAGGHLLLIDQHLVGLVGLDDEGVHVGELVGLGRDHLVDLVVLTLVVHDEVHLLGGRAADVRTEHDVVRGVTVEVLLVQTLLREKLQVAPAAVETLLMLDTVLKNQVVVLVAELLVEQTGNLVEASILTGLEAAVQLGVAEELTGGELPLTGRRTLVLALHPTVETLETLLLENVRLRDAHQRAQHNGQYTNRLEHRT
mmetsp:Transcript_15699/g.40159  ORF Transcript_15699/g.40159 Transcript_15699/m.40159 type:complete len:296 (+) Transcript_15699:1408-2295(+)